MEGYKVFEPDWTCRGFQYEVGKDDVKHHAEMHGAYFMQKGR